MNFFLSDIKVINYEKYPQFVNFPKIFRFH